MNAYGMSMNYSVYATLLHRPGVDTIDMYELTAQEIA